MSGTTVILGYIPDGVTLVPPNSPVTFMVGADAAVDTALAGMSAQYGPGGTAGNIGTTQGDVRWTQKANNLSDVASPVTARGNLGAAQASRTGNRAVGQDEQLVYAMDHGVVANGSTDDTTALTAAIAATPTGGVLLLPPGSTKITSPVVITKAMTLRGPGFFQNRILASGCSGIQIASGVNNVRIENVDVAAGVFYTTTPNTYIGIQALGASGAHPSNHVYRNVHVDGFQTAYEGNYIWSSVWENFRTNRGPYGLVIYGQSVNNVYSAGLMSGSGIAGSKGIFLAGVNSSSDSTPCSSQGWDIHGGGTIDAFDTAIDICGNNVVRVRGMTLDHCGVYGVYIHDSGGTVFAGDCDILDTYIALATTATSAQAAIGVNNTVNSASFNWANRLRGNILEAYTGSVCPYGVYIFGAYSLCSASDNIAFGFKTADFAANIPENTFVNNRGLSTGLTAANFYTTFRQYAGNNTGSFFNPAGDPVWTTRNGGRRFADGTQAPTSGSVFWAVGDRVFNRIPAVGSPKSWVCTVAGSPGTWVSEGNL